MPQNPPRGIQRIIPYLLYADAPAAIDFICNAFGFEERFRVPASDGKVTHAELAYKENVVMLATAVPDAGHASPRDLDGRRHSGIAVYVDDVDAHYAIAKSAGAEIIAEPADQHYGDRTYRAKDPEGHDWTFLTHVKDVSPEDLIGT